MKHDTGKRNMRVELIHPLVVAFPLAFLLLGSALRLAAYFVKTNESYASFMWFSRLILSMGLGFGILALITGEISHEYVHEMLCVHETIDQHEFFAYTAILLYGAGLLLDWRKTENKPLKILCTLIYWIAPIFLILAGIYGGKLVFEQGIAVEKVCKGRTTPDKPKLKTE
jgi:uncharacterized membrane protein